jgi:hypothetical protein
LPYFSLNAVTFARALLNRAPVLRYLYGTSSQKNTTLLKYVDFGSA